MQIKFSGIQFDAPGTWESIEIAQPGCLVYREVDGEGRVTVMLLSVKPVYAIADRKRLLGDYVHHRMQFELGQSPSLQQSESMQTDGDGSFEARWSGVDTMVGRRQRHRAILRDSVLADFCYEGMDDSSFDERADALLASAAISIDSHDGATES